MRCPEIYITETNHEVSLRNPTSKRTQTNANERKRTQTNANDPSATSQRKNAILRFHLRYQGLQT